MKKTKPPKTAIPENRHAVWAFGILGCVLLGYGVYHLSTGTVFALREYPAAAFGISCALVALPVGLLVYEIILCRETPPAASFLVAEGGTGLIGAVLWSLQAMSDWPYFAHLRETGVLQSWQSRCLRSLLVSNLALCVAAAVTGGMLLYCCYTPRAGKNGGE